MRPVGRKVNQALQAGVDKANFGLYFNKWVELNDRGRDRFKPKHKSKPEHFIDSYGKCCCRTSQLKELLEKRQLQQSRFCEVMSRNGWNLIVITATLKTPFVTGLGMTHPTETGIVLDWTLGVPYVPATSFKGVFRFSFILSDAESAPERVENGVWEAGDDFFALFGRTAEKGADDGLRGGIMVLDAYPLTIPKLDLDILNPHYPDYYRNAKRAPTEDQNPVPVKFLVVKPNVEFVFRILISQELSKNTLSKLKNTLAKALERDGLGAKTALGYGKFQIVNKGEPQSILKMKEKEEAARKEAEEKAKLEAELASLPGDLAWLKRKEKENKWESDNGAFLNDVESFFEEFPEPGAEAVELLTEWLDKKWKGIIANPDAVKGKKQKPKFKQRPRQLAKKINELVNTKIE